MSPLRILHVVPYYEQAWAYGGIPRLATTMTRALARRGHCVTVYTTDARDGSSRADARADGGGVDVRMFRNLSNRLAYRWQVFTPIGMVRHLRSALGRGAFDVAHLHACYNLPGTIAARELSRAGVPYVVSPNGTARAIERRVLAKRIFGATAGRRFLSRAARVIAVTDAERHDLISLGVDEGAIAVVPNPIDEQEFDCPADPMRFRARHGLDGGVSVVLFLGKLTPRKGVDVLVRAFGALDRRDTTLVIAGNDMGSGAGIDALTRQLCLGPRVRRVGLLTGSDRRDALAAADVVVYPSRDEIFGLVPLEALLCGTPVVVCGDSGCGEVIARVGGGNIVPYGDVAALRGAIDSILSAPGTWRSRAATAAERTRGLFGSDVVCRQLEDVYAAVRAPGIGAGERALA